MGGLEDAKVLMGVLFWGVWCIEYSESVAVRI